MHLIVRDIDYANHAITIEVGNSTSLSHHDHVAQYLHYCSEVGFSDIRICYPNDLPMLSFIMLQELQKKRQEGNPANDLSKKTMTATEHPASGAGCQFTCTTEMEDDSQTIEYEFRCSDFCDVLDHITATTLLIGNSVPLDEESLSYLRLSSYELGANSVEHGRFQHGEPEARLNIVVLTDHIEITYRDNSEEFCTITQEHIDIADNIQKGRKRGLGLYLLQKITNDLRYERDGNWNRTTFRIERNTNVNNELNRRARMNNLTITTTPTGKKDTVVVTPAGSINSSTVPQLDSSFGELVGLGASTIVVDLSDTEFISSSGVGLLLGSVSSLREKGGDLVLMNIPSLVNDIFDILNIKMHFRIIENLDELKTAAKS